MAYVLGSGESSPYAERWDPVKEGSTFPRVGLDPCTILEHVEREESGTWSVSNREAVKHEALHATQPYSGCHIRIIPDIFPIIGMTWVGWHRKWQKTNQQQGEVDKSKWSLDSLPTGQPLPLTYP